MGREDDYADGTQICMHLQTVFAYTTTVLSTICINIIMFFYQEILTVKIFYRNIFGNTAVDMVADGR